MGAALIHADIRTDMMELTSVFRKTANAQGTAFEPRSASNSYRNTEILPHSEQNPHDNGQLVNDL